ncbi:MAG: insulinase family protein [Bryobacteraceae bacterium]|nr:insulinase family protein [Bryobacterales bacterium]MEB2359878.1 pitrilysin family protein [Bryobacterales bacterium]NUN00795.1 insulinase family protein [Bryobacteraceae bacterium]
MTTRRRGSFPGILTVFLPLVLSAQSLQDFEKRVTEFTLPNGMHFIVLERHEAPVVSFHAYANVGSVDDPSGKTGLAHMFEHMIGKGTETVGTKNWPAEKKALEAVEEVYDRLEAERRKELEANPETIKKLEAQLQAAIGKANSYVVPNLFVRVIEENGAAGFNASTGSDATRYYYSLPSNRIELWFLLQSEWFKRPVFREFYKERSVVREERRMRVESNPQGKLQELLTATTFIAHPYRTMIGWASDIENLRAKDAEEFFKTYYVPGNVTIAIAGDVNPAQAKQFAQKYFGPIPGGELPPRVITEEPPQEGTKTVTLETAIQPFVFAAYKRPDQLHKDDPVFDVLGGILSSGRTGILYKELVRDKQLALGAVAIASFPGGKYPNAFLFIAAPNPGKTIEEIQKAWQDILRRLKEETVDAETLKRVKTKIRASLIRQLDSNPGLASQLAFYHVSYGDWRKLFTGIQEIDKVTAADVQRVARQYLNDKTATLAYTTALKPASKGEGK